MDDYIKEAAAKAAMIQDQQLLKMLQNNGLGDLFKEYLMADANYDHEALRAAGYMIIRDEVNGLSRFTLLKVLDDVEFKIDFSVKIGEIKMKGGE